MKQKLRLGDNYALLATNDTKHKRKRAVHAPLDIRSSSVRFSLLLRCFSAALLLEKWRRNGKQTDNKGKTGSTDNPQVYSRCCASNGLQRKISGAEADNLDGQSLWGKQRLPLSQIPPSLIPHPCPIPVISVYPSVKVPKIGILTKVWRLYGGIKAYTEGYGRCIGSCIKKSLLCVQTHAQAPAHPGRGRANGVLALLLLAVSIGLQASPLTRQIIAADSITPLQIGDAIPEKLWDMPLQVVNHPEGEETITLEAYRGKTILLDFLSTGCSGCIKAIPKLEAIGLEFGGSVSILPITPEKRDRVASFIPANSYVKGTRLPFVVEDRLLKQYFPHLYISHVVWIDAQGVVRATTGTNHVTASTVSEFQSGKALDWPIKTENTPFFNAPLVTLNAEANALPHNTNRPMYYTVITGYTEGIGPYVATEADSLMGIRRVSYRNRSILDLYRIAIAEHFPTTDIIWDVKDSFRYEASDEDDKGLTKDQWNQKYAICYERIVPLGTPKKTWQKLMLDDLNNFLNLNGRMETRNGKRYFVLSEYILNK